MTGYSLCSTAQPDTDFLLIDPIIGAIIIIPNHKEMDGMLSRENIFLSFTRTPENMCFLTHSDTFFMRSATTVLSKFQKGNEPRQKIIHNNTCQSIPYRKHRQRTEPLTAYHGNMSGSQGHTLITFQSVSISHRTSIWI